MSSIGNNAFKIVLVTILGATTLLSCKKEAEIPCADFKSEGTVVNGNGQVICFYENQEVLQLMATGEANDIFLWQDGSRENVLNVSESGIYTVKRYNIEGQLISTKSAEVKACENAAYFPSSFTPDQDGINEQWSMRVGNIVCGGEITIRNEKGQTVFTKSFKNELFAWDGLHQETEMAVPSGNYYYSASIADVYGGFERYSGLVVLIR